MFSPLSVDLACTELETITMDWLAKMMELPETFLSSSGGGGVIQTTAGDAVVVALLAARARALEGLTGAEREAKNATLVVYYSDQTHSIITNGCMVLGIPAARCHEIPTTKSNGFRFAPQDLQDAIDMDVSEGLCPLFVCASVGTTSSCAVDPLEPIGLLCEQHGLWFHVDAA
jgi:tyrosine decarboxylase